MNWAVSRWKLSRGLTTHIDLDFRNWVSVILKSWNSSRMNIIQLCVMWRNRFINSRKPKNLGKLSLCLLFELCPTQKLGSWLFYTLICHNSISFNKIQNFGSDIILQVLRYCHLLHCYNLTGDSWIWLNIIHHLIRNPFGIPLHDREIDFHLAPEYCHKAVPTLFF